MIGTVSTDEKAEIARNLGCHHVINYTTEDLVAVTRKITGGKGVDVVYESIGKDTLKRSLDCLRRVGMCAAYGQRQAFLIRSTSSRIWALVGHSLSLVLRSRITYRTEAKSTPQQNPCSMPSHEESWRATL